jgi:hypothetical protein
MRAKSARTYLLIVFATMIVNRGVEAEYRCDTSNVLIVGDDMRSVSLACDGAKRATAFLGAQGLDVSSEIRIELVNQLANEGAAGHLLAPGKKALVLSYPDFQNFGDWLRMPINTEIYRALVAHEVAHVVAANNFQIPKPTVQAHEYIAYVTTFATMDAVQRKRVLEKFPGDGFETELQMNTAIYLCDPMRFGAEAYRHFVKKGKDTDYFRLILSGYVMIE